MSGLVGDRPIQYRRWGPAASIRLLADHDLLQQAVINLLTNAVEAVSDALDPMISVHCNSDGECLTITIIDNGKGLPSEAEEVFVPFYTTKPGGSGIGLSLVRQIAMAHRGTVRAERNGRAPGATFRLVLPVIAKDGGSSTSQPTDTDLIEGDGR
jgi:signal transduction histidine kinase